MFSAFWYFCTVQAVKASCNGRGAKDWSKLANPSAYIMSIISPFIRKR
jgi:hypothetical protein